MILEGSIDDRLKATFEPSDTASFQFNVPNGVTGSNTFNKLVIETQQTDDNSAFYIQKGMEVS
jgi:regulatory protein YycH of two-component signal transduction system YycFG